MLVVGPGPGEELPALIAALPKAKFTLLEPSAQMAQACIALLQQPLDASTQLDDAPFAVVICHHVVHLMPPDQQRLLLQQLAAHVAPGGVLLLSSLSEPTEPMAMEQVLAISRTRLALLGMEEQAIEQFMAGLNTVVFGLSVERLAAELTAAGYTHPSCCCRSLAVISGLVARVQRRDRIGIIDVVVENVSRQPHLRFAGVDAEIFDPLKQWQEHPRQSVGGAIEEGVMSQQKFGGSGIATTRLVLSP